MCLLRYTHIHMNTTKCTHTHTHTHACVYACTCTPHIHAHTHMHTTHTRQRTLVHETHHPTPPPLCIATQVAPRTAPPITFWMAMSAKCKVYVDSKMSACAVGVSPVCGQWVCRGCAMGVSWVLCCKRLSLIHMCSFIISLAHCTLHSLAQLQH